MVKDSPPTDGKFQIRTLPEFPRSSVQSGEVKSDAVLSREAPGKTEGNSGFAWGNDVSWRGGRVVECAGFENRSARKGSGSSNLPLSVSKITFYTLSARPSGTFALSGPWILWISYPIRGCEKGMEKGTKNSRRLVFAMTFACREFRGNR